MNYLYTAYAAVWIIHIVYLSSVARRYSRLRDEIKNLGKK